MTHPSTLTIHGFTLHFQVLGNVSTVKYLGVTMRVLQKVLSLGSDYSVLHFIKHIFITNLQSIPPLLKHIFCNIFTQSRKADK